MLNENTPMHIYSRITTDFKYYAHVPTLDMLVLARELAHIHARLDDLAVRDGHTRAWVNGYQEAGADEDHTD